MSYGFKIIVEGDWACFTRAEFKVERVSYDVPTPSSLEGMLKSIYWKPAIRYVIDKIIVFNPIDFINIRRNEVSEKISKQNILALMRGNDKDPTLYTDKNRHQRAAMILKNVRYGIQFHFELTSLHSENEIDGEKKHYNILKRRLENGQCFRQPCLGCSEFPVKKIQIVEEFNANEISESILALGEIDLGYMCYKMEFEDQGQPINNDIENPKYSDKANAIYYRPKMVNGIIDVQKYRGDVKW